MVIVIPMFLPSRGCGISRAGLPSSSASSTVARIPIDQNSVSLGKPSGFINHPHSTENTQAPRNILIMETIHAITMFEVLSSFFSVMVILMSLMIPLSPHPSGRSCRITLVDARMRRLKVGCWGTAMVAMPGQPTLSCMLCLSNNTFGQNANICQQKLIYISIYEGRVKWVQHEPKTSPIVSALYTPNKKIYGGQHLRTRRSSVWYLAGTFLVRWV